jgi:hypothetical protein
VSELLQAAERYFPTIKNGTWRRTTGRCVNHHEWPAFELFDGEGTHLIDPIRGGFVVLPEDCIWCGRRWEALIN